MTIKEYIKEKQKEKFDLRWAKKIETIPNNRGKTFQCMVIFKGIKYYFNKMQRRDDLDFYIVCKRSNITASGTEVVSNGKTYSKKEFKDIFVDYDEYEKELRIIFRDNKTKYEGKDEKQQNHILELYRLQQEYSLAFLKYIGCDVSREKKMLSYSLAEIKNYVLEKKKKGSLISRYYEFLPFNAKRLRKLLKHKICKILINPNEKVFTDYCKVNGFKELHDLLFIPYYSIALLKQFGRELIEQIIKDIKSYIDLQNLYNTYITSDDI